MKINSLVLFLVLICWVNLLLGFEKHLPTNEKQSDDVETFKTLLKSLSQQSTIDLFALHYQSIIDVIEAKGILTRSDTLFIRATLPVFSDPGEAGYAGDEANYLNRSRSLIIAWVSPTDGAVSFFRLKLPADWDSERTYPLYVDLHGLTSIAENPIEYLTNYYRTAPSTTFAFDDGYQISPWGRGNYWYQGISETDIWEGIDVIEQLLKIDPYRKYLIGHSMGGYGAWSIASRSANVWAAIGIQAGALWYGTDYMLADEIIDRLKAMPCYFVVGTNDGLYTINRNAYDLLVKAGNHHVEFVTFNGGHEKLAVNVENMYLWISDFENEMLTGVTDLERGNKNSLAFYPHPVKSDFNVHLKLEKAGHIELHLYDVNGRVVKTLIDEAYPKGEFSISVQRGALNRGLYSYQLFTENGITNGMLVLL